jgi:hypothetical protein
MSNIWISAKSTYVPGPQANAIIESQKPQASYAVTALSYVVHASVQTAPTEPNSAQTTYAVTGLNYA